MTTQHEGRQRRRLTATETDLGVVRQKALLVGTTFGGTGNGELETGQSLDELARLVDTAGADPIAREFQHRDAPDPGTYIGSGKLRELLGICEGLDIDVVVFDDELSPAQQRNIEKVLERDVVDRVGLILDIFAQHAHSQEGMVQVELAQLRYRLPRLRGKGIELSRLAGGIGTRGPGESKLETDRRRIQERVSKLTKDLKRLSKQRATQRKARRRGNVPMVALVGYTNAGKSTLLNRLTNADVLVEDRLFSTLDPTTRRLEFAGGETILLADTVGFVRHLPHQLVEAFRSTLEEVSFADLIVNLVDATFTEPGEQIKAVREVLRDLGADSIPEILVFNKIDAIPEDRLLEIEREYPTALFISASHGTGIDEFLANLAQELNQVFPPVELFIPFERGELLAAIHRSGHVLEETYTDAGTRVSARLSDEQRMSLQEFVASS